VSRSVHTRPRAIRAADRLRAPYAPRRVANLRAVDVDPNVRDIVSPVPRIHIQRPGPGMIHPASRADIVRVLAFFGPECSYGIRSITLARAPTIITNRLSFGRLIVPGRIVLFAQSASPWIVAGRLADEAEERLIRAGALAERVANGAQTVVSWPAESLRDFMLYDVLMHEIGHHLIQHHTGKRTVRVARTKDHEAFADAFARRCRDRAARAGIAD
jgi:hypothetical protein